VNESRGEKNIGVAMDGDCPFSPSQGAIVFVDVLMLVGFFIIFITLKHNFRVDFSKFHSYEACFFKVAFPWRLKHGMPKKRGSLRGLSGDVATFTLVHVRRRPHRLGLRPYLLALPKQYSKKEKEGRFGYKLWVFPRFLT